MAEQEQQFPKKFALNGADYFLLQLDKIMLRTSEMRNVCTFAITLKNQLDSQAFEQSLFNNLAYQWITSLRIKKSFPFSLVQWSVDEKPIIPGVSLHQLREEQDIPEILLATAINTETDSPFKIDLLQRENAGTIILITWHHSLMDAHGGESFIRYLGLPHSPKKTEWLPEHKLELPLGKRAQIAHNMKDFLHDVSSLPLLTLYKEKVSKPVLRYKVLSFSVQQTESIHREAKRHGAGFLLSSFYLAATANAVAYIKQHRSSIDGDVLIPIPLDRRKRGSDEPIIGNQVSFLFYRIPKQKVSDLHACTAEIMAQMKNLMLSEKPDQGLIMMNFMRRVPGALYRLLIKQPTKGLMASFFFSDTGDTLSHSDQLFDNPIEAAIHYPPTMYPPGMTFVFSRFQQRLNITFGYMEDVINEDEVELLCEQLQITLIGAALNKNEM